jgi:hypothetical protein
MRGSRRGFWREIIHQTEPKRIAVIGAHCGLFHGLHSGCAEIHPGPAHIDGIRRNWRPWVRSGLDDK